VDVLLKKRHAAGISLKRVLQYLLLPCLLATANQKIDLQFSVSLSRMIDCLPSYLLVRQTIDQNRYPPSLTSLNCSKMFTQSLRILAVVLYTVAARLFPLQSYQFFGYVSEFSVTDRR